jgi:hypothetical protein
MLLYLESSFDGSPSGRVVKERYPEVHQETTFLWLDDESDAMR